GEHPVVLSDTVGFIRRLPPELVAAFEATLEETRDAALLLHVIDAGDEARAEHMEDVRGVLKRIGAGDVPVIEVFNKIDRLEAREPSVERGPDGRVTRIWLSALSGEGTHLLREVIGEYLDERKTRRWLQIGPAGGRIRAQLYELGAVVDETVTSDGHWRIEVSLADERWQAFQLEPGFHELVTELDIEDGAAALNAPAARPLGA
ncbi:MAG: GTPase HflX, partial [Gammaproteobacteria bacterium]